jgi:hypothetical protein
MHVFETLDAERKNFTMSAFVADLLGIYTDVIRDERNQPGEPENI